MPSPESILGGLTAIAREGLPFSIAWHALIAVFLVATVSGYRPSQRTAALFATAPLVSVSLFAWAFGNPFNAVVFGVGAIASLTLALRLPNAPVRPSSGSFAIAGAGMLAFGWLYPHFLEDRSPLTYLYAAPTGLLPCPTLSVLIGFALLADGFSSRAWSTVLASLGLFYGLFGAFRLGVTIDIALAAGALLLFITTWLRSSRDSR